MNLLSKKVAYSAIVLFFVPLLLISTGYAGGIYKWKDKDGNVHISDTPKPEDRNNANKWPSKNTENKQNTRQLDKESGEMQEIRKALKQKALENKCKQAYRRCKVRCKSLMYEKILTVGDMDKVSGSYVNCLNKCNKKTNSCYKNIYKNID